MKCATEGNHCGTAGRTPRNLDSILDSFSAAGKQCGLGRTVNRRYCVKAFCQFDVRFVGHDLKGRVAEPFQLLLYGLHNARVPVSGGEYAYATRKINKSSALRIADFRIFCGISKKRGGRRDTVRDRTAATFQQCRSACFFLDWFLHDDFP